MKYQPYFKVTISHPYFKNNDCTCLAIQPTEGCQKLLKKYDLLFKYNTGTLSVVKYFTNNTITEPPTGIIFDFFILTDNEFRSFTKLAQKQTNEIYLFSNLATGTKPIVRLVEGTIEKPVVYLNGNHELLGLVKITINSNLSTSYSLEFASHEVTWKYYLISDNSLKNLMVDGTSANIKFIKNSDINKTSDIVFNALSNNFPKANLLVYESEKAISLQQTGRKNIHLINSDNNMVLINHLPNPDLTQNGIIIINTLN